MFLGIDIGNSNVKIGFFNENGEIEKKDFLKTTKRVVDFKPLENYVSSIKEKVESCIISSVVPEINEQFNSFIKKSINIEPIILSNMTNIRITYDYDKPEMIGADRIANVVAGMAIMGSPVLVCDFGTATTISLSLKNNEFSGGLITPGIKTSFYALFVKGSRLPELDLQGYFNIIGRSTNECIISGIYHMQKAFVKDVINNVKVKNPDLKTICTGGFSNYFKDYFDLQEKDLVLKGCFEANKRLM